MAQHIEDVEEELTVLVKGRIMENEVDVEIHIAPIEGVSARKPVIDVVRVDEPLVTAIGPAVVVDHAEVAFVDILGREEEAVVVEPHRSLKLTEVAGHEREAAVAVGTGSARFSRLRVDAVTPR